MAEIEEAKAQYLATRFPGTYVFKDAAEMDKNFAKTWTDGKAEKVPEA